MPFENESVDVVIVAQAFHWFDGAKAVPEIHRVLRKHGRIGLIWNVRDEAVAWMSELTQIINELEDGTPRYKSMNWRNEFDRSEFFTPLELRHFSHVHCGTPETVVDRVGSISFVSAASGEARSRVLARVRSLVSSHPDTRGKVAIEIPYRTDVYWCRKNP